MDKKQYKEATHNMRLQARIDLLAHKLERMRLHRRLEARFINRFVDGIPRDERGTRVADVDSYLWTVAADRARLPR